MLAERVLQIARQGFHHAYRRFTAPLAAVRGRIRFTESLKGATEPRLPCEYGERTGDILENRLPLVIVDRILRSGLCGASTSQQLREAHRRLSGIAIQAPITLSDCATIRFDRLTERYRPVIALCRLFMQATGPVAEHGSAEAIPFLLSMPNLFERYAASWLARRCAADGRFHVRAQETSSLGDTSNVQFRLDLVVYDAHSGRALCVIDTKYKDADTPSPSDVAQVGFYALLKRARLACLVYPRSSAAGWQGKSGDVHTYRGTLDLGLELSTAGDLFFNDLVGQLQRQAQLQ